MGASISFSGKKVLITGAGSGIGRLMTIEFAKGHAELLLLWDIRMNLLEETQEMVRQQVGEEAAASLRLCQVDLSEREQIYGAADDVLEQFGRIDIIVNNAGIVSGRRFLDCSDELVEKTMQVNVMAHMWMAKKFLPPMIEANNGQLVNIVSAAATTGVVGLADYCASKWAAFGFDESIRMELKAMGKTGVRTTCVCPYYINTGMFDGVRTNFILPILNQNFVVKEIMSSIRRRRPYLFLPRVVSLIYIMRALLPTTLFDWFCAILGISKSMSSFKGRGNQWALGQK